MLHIVVYLQLLEDKHQWKTKREWKQQERTIKLMTHRCWDWGVPPFHSESGGVYDLPGQNIPKDDVPQVWIVWHGSDAAHLAHGIFKIAQKPINLGVSQYSLKGCTEDKQATSDQDESPRPQRHIYYLHTSNLFKCYGNQPGTWLTLSLNSSPAWSWWITLSVLLQSHSLCLKSTLCISPSIGAHQFIAVNIYFTHTHTVRLYLGP